MAALSSQRRRTRIKIWAFFGGGQWYKTLKRRGGTQGEVGKIRGCYSPPPDSLVMPHLRL